jgi:hypothetical protein
MNGTVARQPTDTDDKSTSEVGGAAERAHEQVRGIVRGQEAAVVVSDGYARRALMLATRLQSLAADLQNPAISPQRRDALRKMVESAECAAWGCQIPALLAHERVTRALTRAATRAAVEPAESARAAAYDLAQWYPEAMARVPLKTLEEAIKKIRARGGKDDAIANVSRLLGLDGFKSDAGHLRSMASRRRAKRYGNRSGKHKS